MSLSFVDKVVENVVDLFPNVCSQSKEFPINPM
jgi:hypothetical protein